MTWLNYHHLMYFWAVAKEGTITAACQQLRLAQPTVSTQLRILEKTLGHKLFEHQGRKLVLTETGRAVYRYANEIFSLGQELVDTLEGRPVGGRMRLELESSMLSQSKCVPASGARHGNARTGSSNLFRRQIGGSADPAFHT